MVLFIFLFSKAITAQTITEEFGLLCQIGSNAQLLTMALGVVSLCGVFNGGNTVQAGGAPPFRASSAAGCGHVITHEPFRASLTSFTNYLISETEMVILGWLGAENHRSPPAEDSRAPVAV